MARRHWLDPLARRLLTASGQLPPPPREEGRPAAFRWGGRANQPLSPSPAGACEPSTEVEREEQLERDLLALKLAQTPALRLRDAEEVRRAACLGWRLDVNRATPADWARLPGCTPAQADLLTRLQAGGVQLSGPDDLRAVLNLDSATLACWLPLLVFRWYGEAPLAADVVATVSVNQASLRQLERLPGLTPERAGRLLRERGRRPFRDLADLGARLALPAAVLESWIGRVSFTPGPAGPELPPAPRSRPSR